MRSTPVKTSPERVRRAWEAPAITELPIGSQTRTRLDSPPSGHGSGQEPSQPAAPATKLGFSFEMSFPLAARTDS
jgi:hypothetical protein